MGCRGGGVGIVADAIENVMKGVGIRERERRDEGLTGRGIELFADAFYVC